MKSPYLSLNPFIPWMKEKHPVEWPKKFGRSAELEVEIGFGLGDFLVQQAQAHPEKDFLGIELGWVFIRRALRKITLAGVKKKKEVGKTTEKSKRQQKKGKKQASKSKE